MTAEQVWTAALGELALQMTKATFDTWLRPTRALRREGDVLVIGVTNMMIVFVIVIALLLLFLTGLYLLMMLGPIGRILVALILVGVVVVAVLTWS